MESLAAADAICRSVNRQTRSSGLPTPDSAHDKPFRLEEVTIEELPAAIRLGQITCVEIVQHYLARACNGVASALITTPDAPIPDAPGVVRAQAATP